MIRMLLVALSVSALSGCWLFHRPGEEGDSAATDPDAGAFQTSASSCVHQVLTAGEHFAPVDMVWVVDSSLSMDDEQDQITATINKFVEDAQARSYDVRLVMVTDDNIVPEPLGSDSSRYRFVSRTVRSNEPLEALLATLPEYQDFLRPDAALHFVAVTDDESALSADDFRMQMDAAIGRPYVFHAVASPDIDGMPCRSQTPSDACVRTGRPAVCGAAAIGTQYLTLAEELGGEEISICVDDWQEVLGPLLEAVTPTEIPCSIELPNEAPHPDALESGGLRTRVQLSQESSLQSLERVTDPESCGRLRAYYIVTQSRTRLLSLCPSACTATRIAGVSLHLDVDCE